MHDLDVISSDSTDQNRFCMLMPCVLHLYEGAFDGRQQCVQCLSTRSHSAVVCGVILA